MMYGGCAGYRAAEVTRERNVKLVEKRFRMEGALVMKMVQGAPEIGWTTNYTRSSIWGRAVKKNRPEWAGKETEMGMESTLHISKETNVTRKLNYLR